MSDNESKPFGQASSPSEMMRSLGHLLVEEMAAQVLAGAVYHIERTNDRILIEVRRNNTEGK